MPCERAVLGETIAHPARATGLSAASSKIGPLMDKNLARTAGAVAGGVAGLVVAGPAGAAAGAAAGGLAGDRLAEDNSSETKSDDSNGSAER